MKTFFRKHRIVLFAMLVVLGAGILSGLVMAGAIRFSLGSDRIETVADARVTTPQPTEQPIRLSAQSVASILATVNARRRFTVPALSNHVHNGDLLQFEQRIWKTRKADGNERMIALRVTEDLLNRVFSQSFDAMTGVSEEQADVSVLTDSEEQRASLIRISDAGGVLEVTLRAEDLAPVNMDLLVYPEYESDDADGEIRRVLERLGSFGTVRSIERYDMDRETLESVYRVETDDAYLTFSFFGASLSQVSVYPSRDAMQEGVFFAADLQGAGGEPAYPEQFAEADAPQKIGSLNKPQQRIHARMKRLFSMLEHTASKDGDMKVTFWKDQSGAREDIWKIEGERIHAVISAYSGNIIELTCEIPCLDLLGIPFEEMGGDAYISTTEWIGRFILSIEQMTGAKPSRQMTGVALDATYDGDCCTMSILLDDGTFYECVYRDGVLCEIRYYADETFLIYGSFGWVADQVRIHPYTGQHYIPYFRAWDGDLHIRKAVD